VWSVFRKRTLLTHSTVQNPSGAAIWFAASQEIPRISRNPKVHYRTHKRPPLVSILSQPNPVHIPTSHLLEIHPNIIHPSTPRSPQWSLSPRFHDQDPIHPPLLTHTRHMPNPSHSSRFFSPAQYWVRGLENGHTDRKQGNGHTERKQGFGMFLSLQPSSGVCILVVNAVAFRLIS
jgi:hypothetical protein